MPKKKRKVLRMMMKAPNWGGLEQKQGREREKAQEGLKQERAEAGQR